MQLSLYICTVKTNPSLRYEGKKSQELNLIIIKDTPMINNHINGELSMRPFHYDC